MRRILLFLFLIVTVATSSVYAQKGSSCPDDLIPRYDKRRKQWGFSDLFGQWIIEPVYTKVSPFVENKAIVQKGTLLGVINCDGNVVLQPDYEQLTNFRFSKVWGMKGGKWGLLDHQGKVLLNHEYNEIFPIEMTELSWVNKEGKWGLLNEGNGRWLSTPQFSIAQVMSENCSLVEASPGKFGVLNHVNGGYLLEPDITSVKKIDSRTILFKSKEKWGVFSNEGRIKANPEYDSIYQASPQLLLIEKTQKFGFIMGDGKVVLEPEYDLIGNYSDGAFLVKKEGKYGYANIFGKIHIQPQYEEAQEFNYRVAVVKKAGKFGIINLRNEFILKPEYNKIKSAPNHSVLIVAESGQDGKEKEFLYSPKGVKISPKGFDEVIIESTGPYIRVKDKGMVSFFSIEKGGDAFSGLFEEAKDFSEGYAQVKKDGKWGIINLKGEFVVPAAFKNVQGEKFGARTVFITENVNFGLYEENGKEILKTEYESLRYCYPNLIKAKKNGKYGVLKSDGTKLVDFIYENISSGNEFNSNPEWPAIITQNGKLGLLDAKLNTIYKPEAESVFYAGDGYFAVKEKKRWGLLNEMVTNEVEAEYDTIGLFGNNLIPVKKGKKWGYLDKHLALKISFAFEEAHPFSDYSAIVKKNGKYGVIDIRGEYLIPSEYDEFQLSGKRRFLIQGDKRYLLKENGNLQAEQ